MIFMVYRYVPEAKSIFDDSYNTFRHGISFGTRKGAENFIKKIRKHKIYTKFRIRRINF